MIIYFGVFYVPPDFVWFSIFNTEMPYFYADIISHYLYLHILSPDSVHGWCAHVVWIMSGVGCEVGQKNKWFCAGGHGIILVRDLLCKS